MKNKFSFLQESLDAKRLTAEAPRKPPGRPKKEKSEGEGAPSVLAKDAPRLPEVHSARPVGRPRSGKRSDPAYRAVTLLVRSENYEALKDLLYKNPEGKDISEKIDELISEYLGKQKKKLTLSAANG